ncbi:unnamed protein product [Victoria cruziana]
MSCRSTPRKEGAPAPDLPRDPAMEDREDREAVQDCQFQMIMTSIQALSNAVQAMAERQQPQQLHDDVLNPEAVAVPPLPPIVSEGVPVPEATVAPPLLPVAPAEPVEPTGITPTAAQHKAFMSTKPP